MTYCEDDLIQLSALQHLVFCERQASLILLEQAWADNVLTVGGSLMHERVDSPGSHGQVAGVRMEYALPIRSLRLGLAGRADAIEVGKDASGGSFFVPVEYKRGHPKADLSDKVQLCAQAICLEEMRGISIPRGALFYGETRHRLEVPFDEPLRKEVETLALRLHALVESRALPPPTEDPRNCRNCSLNGLCLPSLGRTKASDYLRSVFTDAETS